MPSKDPIARREATRRWRERHPERRAIEREYSRRYSSTAKGQLSKIRDEAKRRSQ